MVAKVNGATPHPLGAALLVDSDGTELCIVAELICWMRAAPVSPDDAPVQPMTHTFMCVAIPGEVPKIYTLRMPYLIARAAWALALAEVRA